MFYDFVGLGLAHRKLLSVTPDSNLNNLSEEYLRKKSIPKNNANVLSLNARKFLINSTIYNLRKRLRCKLNKRG